MSGKRKIQMSIDLLMVMTLPMLMAYSLIGEAFHEAAGTIMFILFIAHNIFNYKWYKALFKGRYTPYRILLTVVNMLLLVIMLLLPVSGIIISKHIYTFIDIDGKALWRTVHMLASYWGYVLMSFHLGMHMNTIIRKKPHFILNIFAFIISLYGIYAFISRRIPLYMAIKDKFVLFDFNEPVILFLLDYISVMILFALVGHYISKALKNLI